jgi:hypothetical protein
VPAALFVVSMLGYLWFLAVAVYYTVRPSRLRERVADAAQPAVASGLPAAR